MPKHTAAPRRQRAEGQGAGRCPWQARCCRAPGSHLDDGGRCALLPWRQRRRGIQCRQRGQRRGARGCPARVPSAAGALAALLQMPHAELPQRRGAAPAGRLGAPLRGRRPGRRRAGAGQLRDRLVAVPQPAHAHLQRRGAGQQAGLRRRAIPVRDMSTGGAGGCPPACLPACLLQGPQTPVCTQAAFGNTLPSRHPPWPG
jgi:hypothetical protein